MVHRADHASRRVEADVEQDHRQGDLLAHHPEQHEHVGHHHGREQLEEVLHPEVDDPEAPELVDREVLAGLRDQADRVEGRNGKRGHEEEPGHVARVLAAQTRAQHPPEHEHPDEQAEREQHLPHACQIEVLEALQAEPVRGCVTQQSVHAQERADQGAEHHHRESPEQHEGELALTARLAPGDHRREEDTRRHERRRDPEDGELHVPGAHQVEGEELGQVDPEEAGQLGPVVLRGGSHHHLEHEQRRHHEEEPGAGPLRGGKGDVAGPAEAQRGLLASMPAEDVPAPKGGEQQTDAAEQRDQRQHRPDDHVGRGLVVHSRLRRPVVGVRVVVTGPLRRSGPGRPAEEGGQRGQILTIGDRVRPQPVLGGGLGEEARVVRHEPAVSLGLGLGELENARPLVIAIGAKVLDRAPSRAIGALAAVAARDVVRGPAQVVGGVVGAQVGAMAEYRPVLHEAVVEEDLLPALDVALGVDQLA